MNIEFEGSKIDVEIENSSIDVEVDNNLIRVINDYKDLENKPTINGVTLEDNKTTKDLKIDVDNDYSKSKNKPSINGVTLEGNKTTKDLKIEMPKVDLSNYYNKEESNELLVNKENKFVWVEMDVNLDPITLQATLREWKTENPYEVIDNANKQGIQVMLKCNVYIEGVLMEIAYCPQTIYADSDIFGKFKYFLTLVDNQTLIYARIESTGFTTIGLRIF